MRIATILVLSLVLAVSPVLATSAKIRLGDRTIDLSAAVMEVGAQSVVLDGKAIMKTTYSSEAIKPGTIRLDEISADKITVNVVKDAKGRQTPSKAFARGGVSIRAKRADQVTDSSGKADVVIRHVYATATEASMTQSDGLVVLTGKVFVKVTEPGEAEPVMTISDADKVTVFLNENKITFEGKPADLGFLSREGDKK